MPAGAVAALKKEDAKKTGGGFDLQGRPMYTKRTLSFPFRFFFSHMGRLVRTGYSRRLEPADLVRCSPAHTHAARALTCRASRQYIEPELDTVKARRRRGVPRLWSGRAAPRDAPRHWSARSAPPRTAALRLSVPAQRVTEPRGGCCPQ